MIRFLEADVAIVRRPGKDTHLKVGGRHSHKATSCQTATTTTIVHTITTMKSVAVLLLSLSAVTAFAPVQTSRSSTQLRESLADKVSASPGAWSSRMTKEPTPQPE
jgi:hypothetical protein